MLFVSKYYISAVVPIILTYKPTQNYNSLFLSLSMLGFFLKKIVRFCIGEKKINVFSEVKNKKFVLHSANFFSKPFSLRAIRVCK